MGSDKVPAHAVGGTRDEGPWPEGIEEIVAGEAYTRPVTLADGTRTDLEVTVNGVGSILREDGTTAGKTVRYHYDDPTLGGDGS